MPHFQNDHERRVVDSVVITTAQLNDLKAYFTWLNDRKPAPAVLSDAQFEKLIAMLQPGFELSTRMLTDYNRQQGPVVHEPPPSDYLARAAEEARQREGARPAPVIQGEATETDVSERPEFVAEPSATSRIDPPEPFTPQPAEPSRKYEMHAAALKDKPAAVLPGSFAYVDDPTSRDGSKKFEWPKDALQADKPEPDTSDQ